MTQRIFKAYDDNDVRELFELLPDYVIKLRCERETGHADMRDNKGEYRGVAHCLNIKWGDLTEIQRPEDYSKYIGKLGIFGDDNAAAEKVAILGMAREGKFAPLGVTMGFYENFRPLTIHELKEKNLIIVEE